MNQMLKLSIISQMITFSRRNHTMFRFPFSVVIFVSNVFYWNSTKFLFLKNPTEMQFR